MASFAYDAFMDQLVRADINLATDTFYAMLTTSTYVPNQGTHAFRSDVTNEVTGTGYTAGGAPITVTLTKDTTNHREQLAFSSVSWASSTITARHMVVYKHRGGAATADELLFQVDFGSDVSSSSGAFTVDADTLYLGTPV